jgi:hypothetical protein
VNSTSLARLSIYAMPNPAVARVKTKVPIQRRKYFEQIAPHGFFHEEFSDK